MSELTNSAGRFLTVGKFFSAVAANDRAPARVAEETAMPNGFTREEVQAITEAVYPYGGSYYRSPVTFNGVDYSGEKIQVCIPLSGKRTDSHVLTISKQRISEDRCSYETEFAETRSVLPSSDFGRALKIAMIILKNGSAKESLERHHTHNG